MGIYGLGGYSSPCGFTDVFKAQCVIALLALHVSSHWALRPAVRAASSSVVLVAGAARSTFVRDTALNAYAFVFHSILGPFAAYCACEAVLSTPTPPSPVAESLADVGPCVAEARANIVGVLYTSWSLFQMVWIVLGWESGIDNYIHHVVFLSVSLVGFYFNVAGELFLFAGAMEVSTPPLNVMLTAQQVEGSGSAAAADKAGAVFVLLFFTSRVAGFGYGLWRSLSFWWAGSPVADLSGREGAAALLHVLFGAGWIVQLFWARVVLGKLRGMARGKKEA